MKKTYTLFLLIGMILFACTQKIEEKNTLPLLKVSDNHRFLVDENGDPFFWLGDTGWLLFKKCNREEAVTYLKNRKQKGFNVIQVMVLHDLDNTVNVYGDAAFEDKDVSIPITTEGNLYNDDEQYDFWDHVDYIIKKAGKEGIYMALVPVWGSNIKNGSVTLEQASKYAEWLANRYKDYNNIIWLNGGDTPGSDSTDIWNAIGNIINKVDTNHLITFHPRGRLMSSDWFHNEDWLDFNMFQSGHRRYDQDDTERAFGQDNWRYVELDYQRKPVKPTIDGEPSYEHIPQGLHDTLQPFWNENDVRRYAYWSVFSGAFGHTYGHNSIMQFYKPGDTEKSFGVKKSWTEAMDDPGASQMIHLKNLILSKPFLERVPDQSIIADGQGEKYDYIVATRGNRYALIYTYTGNSFSVDMGKFTASEYSASWFNPRNGTSTEIGEFLIEGVTPFDPPSEPEEGNDWVLVLDFF